MEPEQCSRCRREAVARQPYSGRALCADHLVRDVESRARRTIRQQAGIRSGDRIGVLVGDGPYEGALLAFVVRQFASRRDVTLLALVPGEAVPAWLPEEVESAAVGPEEQEEAAARLGCTVLVLPVTLEERAAEILGTVLEGRPGALVTPVRSGRVRTVRPFEHVPGAELLLYLAALGSPGPGGEPSRPADPFAAFVADELATHTVDHPSAPFALVRLADSLAALVAGEPDRC